MAITRLHRGLGRVRRATETIQNTDKLPRVRQELNLSARAFIILTMAAELQYSALLI